MKRMNFYQNTLVLLALYLSSMCFAYAVELTPLPTPPAIKAVPNYQRGIKPPQYLIQFNQKLQPLNCQQLKVLAQKFADKHQQATTNRNRAYYGQHRTLIYQWLVKKNC